MKDKLKIEASVDEVWAALQDLSLMELWNPKCKRSGAPSEPAYEGLSFEAEFQLSRSSSAVQVEVLKVEPGRELALRHTDAGRQPPMVVVETFRLEKLDTGCVIHHEVDMSQSGLPVLVRWLASFLSRYGRSAGPSSLEGIRALVEVRRERGG